MLGENQHACFGYPKTMKLVLDYRLYPEDFWMIEQAEWGTATLSDFDTIHFRGDLIFRCSEAVFDYRNIPILGSAYEFTEAFLKCIQGLEVKVEYCFMEGNDWLFFSPVRGEQILIQASYTTDVALVSQDTLRSGLKQFNKRLIEEVTHQFPFLKHHPIFQQITAVLSLV